MLSPNISTQQIQDHCLHIQCYICGTDKVFCNKPRFFIWFNGMIKLNVKICVTFCVAWLMCVRMSYCVWVLYIVTLHRISVTPVLTFSADLLRHSNPNPDP